MKQKIINRFIQFPSIIQTFRSYPDTFYQMTSNLWNKQSPTKRIDLYFKIDEYKKHLLHLQNVKSTFKKSIPQYLSKTYEIDINLSIRIKSKRLKTQQKVNRQNIHSQRVATDTVQLSQNQNFIPYKSHGYQLSRINSRMLTPSGSPNKYRKFRDRQINQENKMILKKLENVKPSPQLSKKKLFHKYSISDLKYKINLQKTKYKNVDFTRQAGKLLKGQKIKFSKIKMGNYDNQNKNQRIKFKQINLDWKLSKKNIFTSNIQCISLPKAIR